MTQEEKTLLQQDLCARLPYGVKVHINSSIEEQNSMELFDLNLESEHIGVCNEKWSFRAIPIIDEEDETKVVKPYLRSMSNMTEEERFEYFLVEHRDNDRDDNMILIDEASALIDWLIAHHFDYRDLISKGLALEAPKGMYKTK